MKQLIVIAEAEAELDRAMTWYDQRRVGLGSELHEEVHVTLDSIRRSPSLGWKYGDEGYRVQPVDRFPYLIYYLETDDAVWIAAIAHERQQPDYWRDRLTE